MQADQATSGVSMAESPVLTLAEAFVSHAIKRLDDLLTQESASLSSVKEDVESLRTELTRIKCFLEDASHKQEQDKARPKLGGRS